MPRKPIEYEEDFYVWTIEQSRLLRAGELSAIDAVNIAEEIERMGAQRPARAQKRLVGLVSSEVAKLFAKLPPTGQLCPQEPALAKAGVADAKAFGSGRRFASWVGTR